MDVTLPEWLAHRARLSPERPALIAGGASLTYEELEARVSITSARLAAAGILPGDAVAVLCGNGLPFALLAHAIPRLGAILVPINTRLTVDEIRYQLDDVRARALVVDAPREATGAAAGGHLLRAEEITGEGVEGEGVDARSLALSATRAIIYTSGTTGRPKGAILTHGNFWHSAIGSALNLGHVPDDRWLAVLPLFHVGGLSILYRCTIYGITAIVHERFDEVAVNRAIDEDGVTIVSAVSAMLGRMLDKRGARPYPPTLRCVLLGGGPAPLPLLERCAAARVPVVQTYGLTETCSQAATLAPEEALARLGSAGKALMTAEIRVEIDGCEAGPGETGEILVRGPIVTPGYINRPGDTARALAGGWLRTGDVGRLEDGYLYVLDRRDDLIVSGGENVYPAEVEAALLMHPAVVDAGVFGVPDERWGNAVAAAVVPGPGVRVDDEVVLDFCRARLASYKVPRTLVWVESLPRNAGGKLLRRSLAEHTGLSRH